MGFLSDKEIEERVSSPDNLMNRLHLHEIQRGRTGSPNVPLEIQKTIAIIANEEDAPSVRELGESFGISKSAAHTASIGQHYNPGGVNPELKSVIQATKDRVSSNRVKAEDRAIRALLSSLSILPDTIKSSPKQAKMISGIAKDLSVIANNTAHIKDTGEGRAASIVVHMYTPKQKAVSDYEVIDV